MKKNKIIGILLIGLSLLVVIALIIGNSILWLFTDILMILLCAISGVILFKQNK